MPASRDDKATDRCALVTGGAGFIGSHLAEHLVALGFHVTVVDDLSTGLRSNLDNLSTDRCRFIEARVVEAVLDLRAQRFDRVFHLAAEVGVELVLERPAEVIESSLGNAKALLTAAAESWRCPVLLASSSEVYGKSEAVPFREDDDVVYGPTSMTRWSYAYAKAMDEFIGMSYHRRTGLPVVVARFFNTVGPRQRGHWGMVLPRFVQAALDGRPLPVYGSGEQRRCFCDVRDVVAVLPRLLDSAACHGRVFNVGGDESISIAELARGVVATLGSASRVEVVPYERAYGPGFEDVADRRPDLSRLRAAVGFSPRITLDRTIRDLAASLESCCENGADDAMDRAAAPAGAKGKR